MDRLTTISHNLESNTLLRHLFFFFAAILSIIAVGYYFGTFDQVSHIPFLKKAADPSLYPHDNFFQLSKSHYSYFWYLFLPLYKAGFLEYSMFFVHIFATYLTFWSVWKLAETLFDDALASFLSVLAFIIPHVTFAGFLFIEFSLLNRSFVLPFLILSIILYLRRRYILSFALLGILYNLHILSVNFVLAMLGLDILVRFKQMGKRTFIMSVITFFMCAFPILYWKFSEGAVNVNVSHEWFSIISRSLMSHVFYIVDPYQPFTLIATLGGMSSIALFFIARTYLHETRYINELTNFMYAVIIVVLVEIFSSYYYPITILIQTQIIRIGMFAMLLGPICFLYAMILQYRGRHIGKNAFLVLCAGVIFGFQSYVALSLYLFRRLLNKNWPAGLLYVFGSLAVSVWINVYAQFWQPGIHIFPERSYNVEVQEWVKANTPKDAIFITPPYLWWFFTNEWRVVSERTTVVTLSELLEIAFDPSHIDEWKARYEDIAPGSLAQFKGNPIENIKLARRAYYTHSTADFVRLGHKYRASYLVVERMYRYQLPIIYQNQGFTVYSLK